MDPHRRIDSASVSSGFDMSQMEVSAHGESGAYRALQYTRGLASKRAARIPGPAGREPGSGAGLYFLDSVPELLQAPRRHRGGMAASASLASSWPLERGSLEETLTVSRVGSEETGSEAAQGVRDSGAPWCTLRRGEGGEDAPCHVAGEWAEHRGSQALHPSTKRTQRA